MRIWCSSSQIVKLKREDIIFDSLSEENTMGRGGSDRLFQTHSGGGSGSFTLCLFTTSVLKHSILPEHPGLSAQIHYVFLRDITLPYRDSWRCFALQLLLDAGAAEPFAPQVHSHIKHKARDVTRLYTGDDPNRFINKTPQMRLFCNILKQPYKPCNFYTHTVSVGHRFYISFY